ncbi:class I SAM-dependent methyltransferase, partial [Mycobacterium sp. IS-2888]
DQATLAGRISAAGWSAVRWRNLTGGIVALHAAYKALR